MNRLVGMLACCALAHGVEVAEAQDAVLRVTYDEAVRRAEEDGPEVRARLAAVERAHAIPGDVDVLLGRPLSLNLNVGVRAQANGNFGPEFIAGLYQDLSLNGWEGARSAVATAYSSESDADLEVARRAAGMHGAAAWIEARAARDVMALRAQSLSDAEALVRIADARVRAGVASPAEASLARGVVGGARASLLEAEGRRLVADADLRFEIGAAPDVQIEPVGEARELGALDDATAIRRATQLHPRIALEERRVERLRRAAHLQATAGVPPLMVGATVQREGGGDWVALGVVTVPLPTTRNVSQLAISLDEVDALAAEGELERLRAELARDVRLALEDIEHCRAVRDTLETQAVAPMREALREATRRYEIGAGPLADVLLVRRESLAMEERLAEARADVARADAQLRTAIGAP